MAPRLRGADAHVEAEAPRRARQVRRRDRGALLLTRRGRGRPSDRSGEDTRALILDTAQRLFGESGFNGVSMEALAVACGVDARTLYHHFASKRALFRAAADDAFGRFGGEVAARVFTHDAVGERVAGYVDVYRSLHATDPHLLSFIGMVLVDALGTRPGGAADPAPSSGEALRLFLATVVDDAVARGEVHPGLDRDGAVLLLTALGMGLSLASVDGGEAFPAMLDALDLLTTGRLFVSPPPA